MSETSNCSDRSTHGLAGKRGLDHITGPSRRRQLDALKAESEREMVELIRRRLALPVEKRTHFLRVRLPLPRGGSCL